MSLSRRHLFSATAGLGLAAAVGAVSATPAWAANNNDIAWTFFRGKGFTAAQTSGLIGNFIVESGADPINPAAVQYGGGPGRGIAQWEGSRRDALYAYANSRGLPWYNLGLQLDFVWKEFMGPESYAYSQLKATNTPSTCAVAVRKYYERPSVHADEARINAAQLIYSRYAGGTAPSESSFPTLRRGSTGAAVTTLQYLLRHRGHSLTVDGSFGPATESVVLAFQRAKGLAADGIVGPRTWAAVIVTLSQGASGDAVRGLQVELRAAGHSLTVDGSFGPATNTAVRSYQSSNGLVVDGSVGPITWGSLID